MFLSADSGEKGTLNFTGVGRQKRSVCVGVGLWLIYEPGIALKAK